LKNSINWFPDEKCGPSPARDFSRGTKKLIIEELMDNDLLWILVLTVPGVVLLTFAVVQLIIWFQIKRLEPLKAALGGEIDKSFWKGAYLRLGSGGVENRVLLTSGGKNSPPFIHLKRMAPLGFELMIDEENIATRKLGEWGMVKDIKAGDPVFDEKFLIRGSDPARVQNFLMDQERRTLIEEFFNNGFSMIRANKKAVAISKPSYTDEDFDPEVVRSRLEMLNKIAAG